MVRGTFSPARAWRPAVVTRLARTLAVIVSLPLSVKFPMSLESVLPALLQHLGKKILDRLLTERKKDDSDRVPSAEELTSAISAHLTRAANWSATTQVLRMPSPKATDATTVPLRFTTTPRKYRVVHEDGKIIQEDDLAESGASFIVLGPPGSGKTTTIKRLIQRFLTTEQKRETRGDQFPLVIRVRDIIGSALNPNPLLSTIAEELGLVVRIGTTYPQTGGDISRPLRGVKSIHYAQSYGVPLTTLVPRLLNELRPCILLDGLDEATQDIRDNVLRDFVRLLMDATDYRTLLTVRSGEIQNLPIDIQFLEVCDLERNDIVTISQMWLGSEHQTFLKELAASPPLKELATRPLFLTQMLNVFQLGGSLPRQPYEIYELVALLLIKEWDRERGVRRQSKYAEFGPERKLRFLSSLALHLTFSKYLKQFDHAALQSAYGAICADFGLPLSEADLVAREVETHTGIFSSTGSGYEFSHLTIQEYLSGDALARSPFPAERLFEFLQHTPAPLVIATALSGQPSLWVHTILTDLRVISSDKDGKIVWYIERLERENPSLAHSAVIGSAILGLVAAFSAGRLSARPEELARHLKAIARCSCTPISLERTLRENFALYHSPIDDILTLALRPQADSRLPQYRLFTSVPAVSLDSPLLKRSGLDRALSSLSPIAVKALPRK